MGGGDSRLVDALIDRGLTCLSVLDLSGHALKRAKDRLGARGEGVDWMHRDITDAAEPLPRVDLWHDRAVFHFLADAEDRRRYVKQLAASVKLRGAVVMATFALDGPERCSGLPVTRYSPTSLAAELGPELILVDSIREEHRTPGGGLHAFQWSRFTRLS